MVNNKLQAFFCPVCKKKLLYGKFLGELEIKCSGCKSIVRFNQRSVEPTSAQAVEKIAENEGGCA